MPTTLTEDASEEVELQSLALSSHSASDSDEFASRTSVGSAGNRPWYAFEHNPHDGSGRRLRYLLGIGFLIVMIVSSVLYSGTKKSVRAQRTNNDAGNTETTASFSSTTTDAETHHGLSVQDVLNQRTVPLTVQENGHQMMVTPTANQQIQNFRQGHGLILNIHITHHAGTAICGTLGRAPGQKGAPSFACNGVKADENATLHDYFEQHKRPWTNQATDASLQLFSSFYHMLSWEFSHPPTPALSDTDWEHRQLVSVIIMREPLSRLLAGDHGTSVNFPNILNGDASLAEWWEYANSSNTNNFAMRVLAGQGCCQGEDTDPIHLVRAKELVSRFTFVLDLACLTDGMAAVAHALGFEPRQRRALEEQAQELWGRELRQEVHPPVSERIPFPEVYEYLQRRNHLDIELYEWSKKISLVQCQQG